jgi:cobalt-zinc-cadmium efflux system protein
MAHGHAHGAHATRRALGGALVLTVAFGAAQVIAGLAFGSLALIADAVHNLADGGAIALALLAAWAAARPPTARHTYGWVRLEILAALVNGVLLIGLSAWIFWDAAGRLVDPPTVDGGGLALVGLAGVVANGLAAWVLMRGDHHHHDVNVRGALLHAVSDVAGSGGAAIAGVLILAFGWKAADPAMAALIGLLVLLSSWNFVRRPLEILLEATPAGVQSEQVGQAMAAVPGVRDVHDLHIWTVTSRMTALSAHVVALPGADTDEVLHAVEGTLRERFGIRHTTIQVERDHRVLLSIHRPGCPEGPQPLGAPLEEAPHSHAHEH